MEIYQAYLDKYELGAVAKEKLEAFFPLGSFETIEINTQQRIILVAAKFRKEVTSTVLWLMSHKLRIQCFKTEPYQYKDLVFLKMDQIIPTKDTEEYIIRIADKVQEEISRKDEFSHRHQTRLKFWRELLLRVKGKMPVFQSNIPTKDNVLYAGGTDLTSVSYIFTITGNYCSIGLVLGRSSKEENKAIFDHLHTMKSEIELSFGIALDWERMSDNIRSLINLKLTQVNVFDKEQWPGMLDFLTTQMATFEKSLRAPLAKVKANLTTIFSNFEEADSGLDA